MPDPDTAASEAPPLFAPRAAMWLGVVVLVGFAAVLACTLRDAGREDELEHFDQITALGDTHYFVVPSPPPNPPVAIVQWQGRAWVPVDFEKRDLRDTQMLRIGRDEISGLTLYPPARGHEAGRDFRQTGHRQLLPTAPRALKRGYPRKRRLPRRRLSNPSRSEPAAEVGRSAGWQAGDGETAVPWPPPGAVASVTADPCDVPTRSSPARSQTYSAREMCRHS